VSFSLYVALRYFRSGGSQTILTTAVVAVGVLVYVFIGALFAGVQKVIADGVLGTLSHVTADRPEPPPIPYKTKIPQAVTYQLKNRDREHLDNWRSQLQEIRKVPGIKVASPIVTVSGFARRGGRNRPIIIRGVELESSNGILDLDKYRKLGTIDLAGATCVIGNELAKLISVTVGDQVLIESSERVKLSLFIRGIFKTKQLLINESTVFVSLNNGQKLAKLEGEISAIETQVSEIFKAPQIAKVMADRTGLRCRDWTERYGDLLNIFASQTGTQILIQIFALLSVAFGTASVLAVTVVQKSKEIGILKAMGATTGAIVSIFLYLALFVSIAGCILGSVGAGALIYLSKFIPSDPEFGSFFVLSVNPFFFIQAWTASILVGVLSAVSPARKASLMNPVEVIRYG